METPTRKEIRAWLEREIALGLETLPRAGAAAGADKVAARPAAPTTPMAREVAPPARPSPHLPPIASPPAAPGASALPELLVEPGIRTATSLEVLRDVIGDCQRCKLCRGRTNIVFGAGNPAARLMFVGEGPDEDEDIQGLPFVGEAGALLTDIISKGMGLRRDDVYIANVVKCRPPNDRHPQPDEIVACEPFLRRQIELVRPEVIVSLGNFATQALLGDRTPISRRRGNWHDFGGIALMPTFQPSHLRHNPSDKRLVWNDIKLVLERLGLPIPKRVAST